MMPLLRDSLVKNLEELKKKNLKKKDLKNRNKNEKMLFIFYFLKSELQGLFI